MSLSFMRRIFKAGDASNERVEPDLAVSGAVQLRDNGTGTGAQFLPMSRTQLIDSNSAVLRKIRLCYGREPRQFDADILAVVERYADYVNALPATANNYYSFRGGLFRLGLDTAFFALQATDAQIFEGRGTITQRRHLEPRWRHAAFIAGLCAELQPALNVLSVATEDEHRWPGYVLPLSKWLEQHRGEPFHIIWSAATRIDGVHYLYALPHVLPPAMIAYLAERNDVIVPAILAALSRFPLTGLPATMTVLVRRAAALAIDKELRRMAAVRGVAMQGDHLARLLVDAMHDLVYCAATWVPNAEKSRIWHAQDGTFVVWPGAAQDICAYADRERLQGVPRHGEQMLAALEAGGMVERNAEGSIWHIRPPGAAKPVECIKLAAPELLLASQLFSSQMLPPLSVLREQPPTQKKQPATNVPPTAPAAEGSPAQMALPLQDSQPPPAAAAAAAATACPDTEPAGGSRANTKPTRRPALASCLLLPSDVADVLRRALESLGGSNNSGASGAYLIEEGVLIPFEVFKAFHVDARGAVRSLREAGMLAVGVSGNATCTTRINDSEVRGLVLKRSCVTGLPTDS